MAPAATAEWSFNGDSVFPWLRVVDNVEYGLKCRGVAHGERREIARDYLRRVGLPMSSRPGRVSSPAEC